MNEKTKFLFTMLVMAFVMIVFVTNFLPAPVNVYRSASTDCVSMIETREGVITDPAKIKKILAEHNDQFVFYTP